MKVVLVLTVLIASACTTEIMKEVCGKSMEVKERIWDCLKQSYKLAQYLETCFHHLGPTYTGGMFMNSLCGPRDGYSFKQKHFDECVENYASSVKKVIPIDENQLIERCVTFAS